MALADEPPPRPAVSVIPVRQGADGLEVFIQHRVRTMDDGFHFDPMLVDVFLTVADQFDAIHERFIDA